MRETEEIRDKVVLVGLNSPVLKREENADEDTMEELAALVETAGGLTVGSILQNRTTPDPRCFIARCWRCRSFARTTAPPWSFSTTTCLPLSSGC